MGDGARSIFQTLRVVEDLLRGGKASEARHTLRSIDLSKVTREQAGRIADLATRASLPSLALKFLFPIVRSPTGNLTPTPEESLAYATALRHLGAFREATSILAAIDPGACPHAQLQLSFAMIAQWNFKATLYPLENFVASESISARDRLIGNVNLAGALVYERIHNQADPLLEVLYQETRDRRENVLCGNVLELWAQSAILQGLWGTGDRHLFEAQSQVRGMGGIYEFFIHKWRAILDVMKASSADEIFEASESMRNVRTDALRWKHWESLRDCDHFTALARKDEALALHLYFGTPFESFRKRFLREYQGKLRIEDNFYHHFIPGVHPEMILDVETVEISSMSKLGKIETIPLKAELGPEGSVLLRALASDFYSPIRIPTLHESLYPVENFNPFTSVANVKRVILELAHWLQTHEIPLQIVEENGMFSLYSEQKMALRIPNPTPLLNSKMAG